jgi:hypothetical protein
MLTQKQIDAFVDGIVALELRNFYDSVIINDDTGEARLKTGLDKLQATLAKLAAAKMRLQLLIPSKPRNRSER